MICIQMVLKGSKQFQASSQTAPKWFLNNPQTKQLPTGSQTALQISPFKWNTMDVFWNAIPIFYVELTLSFNVRTSVGVKQFAIASTGTMFTLSCNLCMKPTSIGLNLNREVKEKLHVKLIYLKVHKRIFYAGLSCYVFEWVWVAFLTQSHTQFIW